MTARVLVVDDVPANVKLLGPLKKTLEDNLALASFGL